MLSRSAVQGARCKCTVSRDPAEIRQTIVSSFDDVHSTGGSNIMEVKVQSPNVRYTADYIESLYKYQTTEVQRNGGRQVVAVPRETNYTFRTKRRVPRVGVMLVGWGGNNGSTVTAAVLANRLGLSWRTKEGTQSANYYGSVTQASTVLLGSGADGDTVHVPLKSLVPMVEPDDIVIDGE